MEFAACFEQSRYLLLEGALGERLKREYGLKIDGIAAMAPLVYDPQAQKALAALWGEYRGIAQKYGLPFLATTPTRRANRERTALAGYDEELLFDNIAFLKQVRQQTGGEQGMYLGALMPIGRTRCSRRSRPGNFIAGRRMPLPGPGRSFSMPELCPQKARRLAWRRPWSRPACPI